MHRFKFMLPCTDHGQVVLYLHHCLNNGEARALEAPHRITSGIPRASRSHSGNRSLTMTDFSLTARILVIEDNPDDAEFLLYQLKQTASSFESQTVSNRTDFEAAIKAFEPDIIYCDNQLGHQFTAVDAIRYLRLHGYDVPFVLVTGTLNEEVASLCLSEGIDDFVLKSNLKRLPLTLANALNKRQAMREREQAFRRLEESEAEVRNFADRLQDSIEEERSRIARELHDDLGQQLAGLKLGLAQVKKYQDRSLQTPTLETMAEALDRCMASVRRITTELEPALLRTLGLGASIEWLADEFSKKSNVNCTLEVRALDNSIPRKVAICFFRVCQEALTNVLKHADATQVSVTLIRDDDTLLLEVTDNGKGIGDVQSIGPLSFGLASMRERARLIGGRFSLRTANERGTQVTLEIKLRGDEEDPHR